MKAQGGYTMIEIAVSTALIGLLIAGAGSVFSSADGQVKSNRVRMRAATEHRRNLEAVADVIRDADIATLSGFDADGRASSPSFAKVTGAVLDERTHGETQQLQWRSKITTVDDVSAPGAVYLVGASGERLIADRVPADGFEVRQEGSTLVIQLSTYYTTSDRRMIVVSGETAVTLRN